MKQLLLDIDAALPPSLDAFVVGQNAELAHLLQLFSKRIASSYGERITYLWGESGAGKSYLLQALANHEQARFINANSHLDDFTFHAGITLYVLDDCQLLNPEQQIAAFNLFNSIKEHQAFLVAAGNLPPAILMVREDLRTRLGWGLIYQLHGLSDAEKTAALIGLSAARGIHLPNVIVDYMITHYQRDMPALSHLLDQLITHSLQTKRPITLPLLREVMLPLQTDR